MLKGFNSVAMDLLDFIKNSDTELQQLIDLLPLPLFYKDPAGYYLGCNQAFYDFFACRPEDMIGKTVYETSGPEQAKIFAEKDQQLLDNPGRQEYETIFTNKQGATFYVRFNKTTVENANGEIIGIVGLILDISESTRLQQKLERLSRFDELTGLINRREGLAAATRLHNQCQREHSSYAILLLDIDHFKKVNDNYGHACGDKVLQSIASVLIESLRSYDICCRWGGEEFVICLANIDLNGAQDIAERIRLDCQNNRLQLKAAANVGITMSIGITMHQGDSAQHQELHQLLEKADKALYQAKAAGRNQIKVCL